MTYQLMYTALGQAHLAFCDGEERRGLIRDLLPDPKLELLGLRTVQSIETHLAAVRRRGYAVTLTSRNLKLLGLAVPVRQGCQAHACPVMRFPRSAMTAEQTAERYLGSLNATARAILKTLEAQDRVT
jgi:IclR family mhp operon transcriptional activator